MTHHRIETYEQVVERIEEEAMLKHAIAWVAAERDRTGCSAEEAAERFVAAYPASKSEFGMAHRGKGPGSPDQ